MDTLTERFIAWLIRAAASAMLFAGVSTLLAGGPLVAVLSESSVPRAIAFILLQLGVAFVAAGAVTTYLSRPRGLTFPNERVTIAEDRRPSIDGWLIALAATMVAIPAWLVIRLQPFLAEWRRVFTLLASSEILEGANANMSGVVLVPLAGALTPPFIELMTMAAFVTAPVVLVPLLLWRSPHFPRRYVACVVLLSALVFASVRGAAAATLAGDALRQLVDTTSGPPAESAELRDVLNRYTSIVSATAPVLAWTWLAYVIWMPLVLSSSRVLATFAARIPPPVNLSKATDVASITSPPRFPGGGF